MTFHLFLIFLKYHFSLTSFFKNDLYVDSPFSQMLDEGIKCRESENSTVSFFFFLSFFLSFLTGQREAKCFHFLLFVTLETDLLCKVPGKNMKRSAENDRNVRVPEIKYAHRFQKMFLY